MIQTNLWIEDYVVHNSMEKMQEALILVHPDK